jgi:hypothetical protein
MMKNGPGRWIRRTKSAFTSGGWGIGGALIASLCCAPPAVAFALGLGGSAVLVGLAQYKLYFALIGLTVVGAAGWKLLRPIGSCSAEKRRVRLRRIALMMGVFVGGYLAINYLLLPWLYTLG